MKFTVLMSLYYKEQPEYLSQCLQSIRNNTISVDQIVIVYDGPINEMLKEVVNSFTLQLPIHVVELPENVGLGNALNLGMKYCNNDIVVRMDTDDICLPDRFARQIAFLEKNPNVVLLGGAIHEFDENMLISQGERFSVSSHQDIKAYAKKRNPFNHMTVAFRKHVIEEIGGYQHHFLMEDYNLWLRLLSTGYETYNLSAVLVNVRAGRNMISRRKGYSYIKSEIKLAKLKYDLRIDNLFGVMSCAILRIVPRLLPTSMLGVIYKKLRK
ncbi:glycosyltransferase [Citrobacter koseri]|uniref:glycosyltransferase n=1 Tax=Citrobacter koseri TaxID=545 RepID=UPI001B8EBA4F|nr:glycosyltransferase [Citrobacter koseri]MDI9800228.1 glycosyltransferase [Citrobacter koseri]HBC9087578.1 glycosyltransferase [Citrobacter koseri]